MPKVKKLAGRAWVLESLLDSKVSKDIQKGDFIIAGANMGYGQGPSHRTMKRAGVAAVICESANADFLRTSIEHGLPVIELTSVTHKVRMEDSLTVDLGSGILVNLTTGEKLHFDPMPDFILTMLEAGGLYAQLAQ